MADSPTFDKVIVNDKLGIGIDPIAQLHINTSGATSSQAFLESSGVLLKLTVDGIGAAIGTDNAFPLSFQTNGSSHLIITPAGNVGIGEPNPTAAKLQVNGTLKLQQGGMINEFSNDTTLIDNSSLAVPTEQAVKTYVDTALTNKANKAGSLTQDFQTNHLTVQGNLTLGNEDTDQVIIRGTVRSTHSSTLLQIGSPISLAGRLTATGNATFNNVFLGDVGHGSGWAGFSHASSISTAGYGFLQRNDGLYTLMNKKSGGGYLGFRVDNVDKMILNDSGNVGIGTTDPRTQLHVLGRISTGADFTSAGSITFYPPDGFAWFHIDNGPAGGRPLGRLRISHGGTPGAQEIISILQNMNVGIGTASPSARLHVPDGAILSGLAIGVDPPGNINPPFPYETLSTISPDWNLRLHSFRGIYFHAGNSTSPQFGVNPNGTWYGSSRQRKENITTLSLQEAWETLSELNPVKFIFKGDTTQKLHSGFIAEEVPDLISNPEKTMISEMDIIAVLTKVVQEQQVAIAALKEQVKSLKNNH